MATKILITGATGTVGSNIVRELSKRGGPVRAAVHTMSKAENIKWTGVEAADADYGRKNAVEAAFKGIERL